MYWMVYKGIEWFIKVLILCFQLTLTSTERGMVLGAFFYGYFATNVRYVLINISIIYYLPLTSLFFMGAILALLKEIRNY